jgi:hypothetical protein
MFRARFFGSYHFAARYFNGDGGAPSGDTASPSNNPMIVSVGMMMNR